MTPHELNLHIQEYNRRLQQDSEEGLILAYLTAYWQRVKRMPDLKGILNKIKKPEPMSDEQLLAQIKAINAQMGGKTEVRDRN